ncbi:NAD(P)-dependent oxidoreductase [Streptomyces sp. NPDC007084]|uniref:NAD(P)-dependent oxidoreductase n=1 Tax=Streptomyces sp. NPDC007084 TaxID=3154313 RepID=UPI00345316C6
MNAATPPERRSVGVIGLGRMGLPIAQNLLERGFAVIGYRRSGSPELKSAGGVVAGSPAEVAAGSEVLISILPDIAAVEQVVTGLDGILSALRPGTVHLEMSTVDAGRKRLLRDAVRKHGGDLLDAPISGSPGMVRPRRTTVFASGEEASIEQIRDVLDAVAGSWVNTGEFGNGATMKYISGMLMASHTVAAAEAMVTARRAGLDLELVQRTLDNSIAGSALLAQRGPVMRERSWVPAPGPVETLHAILEQAEKYVGALGLVAPVFAASKEVFDNAVADGWSELDIACVHDQIAGRQALDGTGGVA